MVSDALAFDVQVFDPEAPLRPGTVGDAEALVPSDPGYFAGWSAASPPPTGTNIKTNNYNNAYFTNSPPTFIGLGAFVDLGYGVRFHTNAADWSLFSGIPQSKSSLWTPQASQKPIYTYCTWSLAYERNGVDEDGDGKGPDLQWGRAGVDDDQNGTTDDVPEAGWPGSDDLVDEGTNGLDDRYFANNSWQQAVNGIDDVDERETSPPYPVPLRGIQVKIRAIEPDTRQIRQMTLVSDFIPE
jgi:hypothetical protein